MSYRPRTAPPRPDQAAARRTAMRRPVQVAIWVLFAVVALTGVLAGGLGAAPDSSPANSVVLAGQDKGTGAGSLVTSANLSSPELAKYNIITKRGNESVVNPDAAIELLPAYRWRDDVDLVSDLGWRDLKDQGLSAIGGMWFSAASFMWTILLVLMRYGLTTDLVSSSASTINAGFANLADSMGSSGLLAIAFVCLIVAAIGAFFRGNLPKVVAMALMFAMPLGAMQALSMHASSDSAVTPALSPAGIAITGNNTINTVGSKIGTGFGLASKLSDASRKAQYLGGPTSPDCDYYIARLYSTYGAASAAGGKNGLNGSAWGAKEGDLTAKELKNQLSANSGLMTVSYLWERAFLAPWTTAQFGNTTEGALMACHRLEINNATSANEQFVIAGAQTGAANTVEKGPYTGFTKGPFQAGTVLMEDGQAAMFAWAACASDNGSKVRGGWAHLNITEGDKRQVTNKDCGGWKQNNGGGSTAESAYNFLFGKGDIGEKGNRQLDFKDQGDLAKVTSPKAETTDPATIDQLSNVRQTVEAYWGHNSGQRLLWGLIAVLTGGLYLWALGALSLGAIVAQIGLVTMLIVLPVTLLLFALPGNGPAGRHPAGARLLKLTGGFMAAKLVLIIAMTLLIQLIALLESLVGGDGSGIWSAVIPIAAMLALRTLLKSIGFGDITKLGGALAMSGAGGALMAGDKKFAKSYQGAVDPVNQAKSRAQQLNRWSKNTVSGRAATALSKKAGALGLGAGKKAAGAAAGLGSFAASEVKAGMPAERARLEAAAAAGDPLAKAALGAWNLTSKGHAAGVKAAGFLGGIKDPHTGEQLSAGVMERLGSLAGVGTALANQGKIKEGGFLHRFATHNKASASRAQALAEQHRLARGLHAERSKHTDPQARRDATAAFWGEQFMEIAHAAQGDRIYTDGVTLSPAELELEKHRMAEVAGCDPDMVIASTSGLPSLVATTHAKNRVIPSLATDEATIESAKSVLHYLPKDWTARRPSEGDEDYHKRMVLSVNAIGGMKVDSVAGTVEMTDTLAAFGVDTATVEGRAEVLKAARGQASKLSDIVIDLPVEVRRQIEDALKPGSVSGLGNSAALARNAAVVADLRATHALDLAGLATELRQQADKNVAQMDQALKSVGSSDSGVSRAAAAKLAQHAEQVVGDSARRLQAISAEIGGLAQLNSSPGEEELVLRGVAADLEQMESAVQEKMAAIEKLNAQMLLADDGKRVEIATRLRQEIGEHLAAAAGDVEAKLYEVGETQRNAHEARQRAKAMQAQTQLRGRSFAPGAVPVP